MPREIIFGFTLQFDMTYDKSYFEYYLIMQLRAWVILIVSATKVNASAELPMGPLNKLQLEDTKLCLTII